MAKETRASDMQAAVKTFFTSTRYAVAGASSDTAKYGHKIFAWYLCHGIEPTPINPRANSVTISGQDWPTRASVSQLEDPAQTSLSIITPPAVTRNLLQEAATAGVRAVWLQPGTYDDEILRFAKDTFPGAAIGGESGQFEGWCVLVDGEEGLRKAHAAAGLAEV